MGSWWGGGGEVHVGGLALVRRLVVFDLDLERLFLRAMEVGIEEVELAV